MNDIAARGTYNQAVLSTLVAIPTLLLAVALLLAGNGFLGTLLAVRGGQEGFSIGVIGLIMSGYFGGFILGTYACPGVVRRVGHIRAFATFAAIMSSATLLHGFAVHPFVWLLLRVTVGFCMVGIYMVIESWMNVLAAPGQRGTFFSTYMTVALASLGGGQFLLLLNVDYPLVPFALASMLFSLGLVPVALTRVREPQPIPLPPPLNLRGLFARAPAGVVGAGVAGLLTGIFWGMGPVFARGMGLSESGIASFMGGTVFGGVILQSPIGRYSDARDRRKVLAGVAAWGAVVALGIYFGAESQGCLLNGLGFVLGGVLFPVYSLSVAHVNDGLAPEETLGGTGRLLLLNGIGAGLGPLSAGVLMESYGAKTFMLLVAAVFVGFAMYAFRTTAQPPPVAVEEQGEFVALTRTSPAVLEMHPASRDMTDEEQSAVAPGAPDR